METDELLLTLSWVSNRSTHQTRFLFDLCDQDFDRLMKVEAYLKMTHNLSCPNDTETVETMVRSWDKLLEDEKTKKKK